MQLGELTCSPQCAKVCFQPRVRCGQKCGQKTGGLVAVITVKQLEALTAEDAGKRLSLGDSMYGTVRASRDGTISVYVVWRYKVDGRIRQARLGTWRARGATSLKSLRDERDRLATDRRSGEDPLEHKAAAKLKTQADQIEAIQTQRDRLDELAMKQARVTVRGLFDQWQKRELKNRADGGAEIKRGFERDVFPIIGDLAAADVTKIDIQLIVDTMMERNVVRMTKRVLSDLRQMFGFALDRDIVEIDPTARIKKARIGPDVERDRVLGEDELATLFRKLPEAGLAETSVCALFLQLATITRISEVLTARWEFVDLTRGVWTIPATKNGRSHSVILSDFAKAQLSRLHRLTGSTPWCFPASRQDGSVCVKTVTKQVADRQRTEPRMKGRSKRTTALLLAGGQWRPHDLRRTGATIMAELGVAPEVVERCLNHIEPSKLRRTYQQAKYEAPQRAAWLLLGDRLAALHRAALANEGVAALDPQLRDRTVAHA